METNEQDSLEVLRRKNVMLIISGLELTPVEIRFLNLAYKLFKGGPRRAPGTYEWVWIPIVDLDSDWTEQKQKMFESVKERMNWYSVYDHSWIGKPVITFIQREWKYKNRPIIVVLDPQGEVTCLNALYMLTIWGSLAYPFTSSREEALWKEETLKLNLLISGLEFTDWSLRGKYIFLYGGDDPDWIRRFVEEARRVATAANIPLEMVYLGKGNRAEKVEKIRSIITTEKLPTHYWSLYKIWLFWFRIQNMLFSKLQLKQIHNDYDNDDNKIHEIKMLLCNDDDDKVMHEIKKLLSFDKQGGWFILSHVNRIEVTGNATTGLQTLVEYDTLWKEHVDRDGFAKAFKDHYDKILPIVSSCCKFQFSPKIERIQEALTCPECRNNMHVLTTFQCCHGEKTADDEFFFSTVTPPTN
ncbi:unnamed protein product [Sphenostylis stenocarpa]|uniref:Sieve element occlusion C-terminal domain-containing protein n=1 Tax=Sphenostylis stenocarpa TaxID=92480 RepID=A0AA86RKX2_9FABA|nr:unnamed protein product [Sphenostylis stenocarpa]